MLNIGFETMDYFLIYKRLCKLYSEPQIYKGVDNVRGVLMFYEPVSDKDRKMREKMSRRYKGDYEYIDVKKSKNKYTRFYYYKPEDHRDLVKLLKDKGVYDCVGYMVKIGKNERDYIEKRTECTQKIKKSINRLQRYMKKEGEYWHFCDLEYGWCQKYKSIDINELSRYETAKVNRFYKSHFFGRAKVYIDYEIRDRMTGEVLARAYYVKRPNSLSLFVNSVELLHATLVAPNYKDYIARCYSKKNVWEVLFETLRPAKRIDK